MIKRYNPYTNYIMIESNEGKYVKYDDIKHLLERSDNSDYVKCAENICKQFNLRWTPANKKKIANIIKKHF